MQAFQDPLSAFAAHWQYQSQQVKASSSRVQCTNSQERCMKFIQRMSRNQRSPYKKPYNA